jgi:DNA-binding transcriptional MerR regulator/effector-binding domain-containing protein
VLTIGDFSRITHLSIKTLRHYHEVGLLEPAAVDPGSGYRRYALAQIPVAQVIRRFRDLEMPVDRVRAVLAARDLATRNRIIADHLGALEQRLADAQAAVASLKALLGAEAGPIAVELRVAPATQALGIHATVTRADLLAWWRGAIGELEAVVDAAGLTRTGPTGGMFATELFQHDRGEAMVYVPVVGAPKPVGRAAGITVPAAELAITVHRGSYADIDVTYGALGSYVMGHALGVEGPVREHYLVDGRTASETAAWRTEIGWPVFGTRPP